VTGRPVRLPDGVLGMAGRGPDWAGWVDRLPGIVRGLLESWELAVDGWLMHGYCSLVVPVRTADGQAAILKIGFPDDESEHEALGLTTWAGDGAVRLMRADPGHRAMLLEPLDAHTTLRSVSVAEACEVVAGLYPRLHVPAPGRLRLLTTYVDRWTAALSDLPGHSPVPRRLVEHATSLSRDLVEDPGSVGVLVHTDLHYDNVLAATREPWLAIDPKPVSGDPHYEPAPMLWNRWDEVVASGDVRREVRRRFHALVDGAGLDEDRARDWVIVRMVHNASWAVQDAVRAGVSLNRADQEWITTSIAICKAVQD
jgi:streptomycin 6-kinase